MAQAGKGRLNYRCPSCFMRDLDIDMFYDKEKNEYYCMRCQYVGTEEDVLEKNEKIVSIIKAHGLRNRRYSGHVPAGSAGSPPDPRGSALGGMTVHPVRIADVGDAGRTHPPRQRSGGGACSPDEP